MLNRSKLENCVILSVNRNIGKRKNINWCKNLYINWVELSISGDIEIATSEYISTRVTHISKETSASGCCF